jgi:hypothetical protein
LFLGGGENRKGTAVLASPSAFCGVGNAAKPAAAVNTKLTTTADKTDKIGGVSVNLFEKQVFSSKDAYMRYNEA